jgi:glycosyltransferase involved in cell wall biosynthesis
VTTRLLFVTQTVDADHPVLAQTVDVIRALATRWDAVTVLSDSVGRHDLPANVAIRTFGASSRAGRGIRFARVLGEELRRRPRPDAVLVHMVPLFLILSAPLAKLRRVRLALWYTHWHAGRLLKVATSLADVVLSVDRRSFPLESAKVRGIGHAIDIEQFVPGSAERAEGGRLRLLALGRTARWKGYDTMLEALELAVGRGLDAELEICGPQLTEDERLHRAELEAAVARSPALATRVRIEPPLPRAELPALLGGADALVSATQPRESETLDKVVYEAAACGVPVLASNEALSEFLGGLPLDLRFQPRDAGQLADRLLALAAAGAATRAEVGAELRRRVVAGHSVEAWADAVTAALTGGAPE